MAADHTDSPPDYYDEDLTKKVNDPPAARDKAQNSLVPESRYLYYRTYTLDGGIPCKTQYQDGIPFLGRIKATAIPPPYTVASLKRALVHAEKLPDPTGELTGLFETNESDTAMLPGAHMAILTGSIGATPETALALVFHAELDTTAVKPSSIEHLSTLMSPKYLYYRLYTHAGEDASARSFAEGEPALGRIDRALIAPPRDVSSVKRRIAKVEGKPIYIFADLHIDTAAKSPQASNVQVADSCGATAHAPILIVQPERRAGLHNRPLLVLSAPDTQGWSWVQSHILHSDGISHIEKDKAGWYADVYTAVDTKGRTGLHTRFLDEPETGSWQCNVQ
ncbi:hypothetical protein B0H14DRAFT_2770470 [Mycena olivaceomarginata]|nr:hypothetical protein B0H14DRAFT_2770470 [Mycena olivaceomarginata]